MVYFLFQQLGTGADSLCSVCQGVNYTEFSSQVVVTVQLQVQICMYGFLYMVVGGDLSGCGIANVSKNGMKLSSLEVSAVNWICESKLIRCSRNFSL